MIFRSPLPNIDVPDLSMTDFLFEHTAERRDEPALIDGPSGRKLTFGQLQSAVRHAAKGLAERGLHKGDVLALYSPNLPEYAIAFNGMARIGGINTTINPLYTPEELRRQLDDSKAKILITVPALLDKAREACEGSTVEDIIVFGEAEGTIPFDALLDNDGVPPDVSIDPAKDIVALPYSSGTTGLQKGVMLTHRNIVANIAQTLAGFEGGMGPTDVCIGVLPFFHIYGLVIVLSLALRAGARVVTMPRFDLEQFLGLIQDHRVTVAHLVPPIVLALSKHPAVDQHDLSSLRWIMSAAAPLGEGLTAQCRARLGCMIIQGYGLTELSPCSHVIPVVPERIKPGSVGPTVPSTESKIVDPTDERELGPNETGEIWVRGPQVMEGYLGNPEATSACLDDDGWLRTGDIGYADEDGYFYIVDRMKELIKYKGLQVAPAEIEALLLTHPEVADVAVIPKPDEEAGEVPKAFIVAKTDIEPQTIMDFVAEHVAPYKKVREVEFVDHIPKSPSGKILRRVLVDRERTRS
jgi:acyl-CoA synthetase (AMP-forming)/AMP-acid ligase II